MGAGLEPGDDPGRSMVIFQIEGDGMATEISRPAALAGMDEDRIVELDVRADLREGREPFQRIMEAKDRVPEGGALVLRAIFEPAPLYRVLGGHGFEHATQQRAADDWVIWFWKGPSAGPRRDGSRHGLPIAEAGGPEEEAGEADPDAVVLDVRGLEPPEPMVRTLAALDTLPRGHTLVQINVREPRFLLPKLEERGFEYEVRRQKADLVRILIRHRQAAVEQTPGRSKERVLDVRVIPPPEKHPAIFETFAALELGQGFVLVNDHDPKPLRYQFEAEHTGSYGWRYLEAGPAVWRVEITKVAG
jgi:uncharacterized protein (DUF2249 family)